MAIAGRRALVRVSGAPVAVTGEATTADGALRSFTITNPAYRVWDRAAPVAVTRSTDGTTFTAVPAAEYTVNRLSGTVTFATPQAAGTQVRVSASYLPLAAAAEAKEFSYTLAGKQAEVSTFGASYVQRQQVQRDVTGSLSMWTTADRTFEDALTADRPVVLEFYSDSSAAPDFRAWALVSKDDIKAAVDGMAETSVEWEGTPDTEGRITSLV